MENRISLKNLGEYFNPWKIMLMILTDLSRFFQGNKFISTNFMPMFPSDVSLTIFRMMNSGYQRGTLAAKKFKKIYYLTL